MYSQNGFTKIVLRDYMTKQVLYVFDNLLNSKLTALPTPTAVTGREFQLVPFNNTGNGMLVIQPKEMSLDLLAYLYNTTIKEEQVSIFLDQIVTTDSTGRGVLSTSDPILGGVVYVYEVSEDRITGMETLPVQADKSFISSLTDKKVYATYSVLKNVQSINWEPKKSKKYFQLEIENSIESSSITSEKKTMLTIIEKAYLENVADIMDRILSGSLNDFPLNFVILEDRDAITSIKTIII